MTVISDDVKNKFLTAANHWDVDTVKQMIAEHGKELIKVSGNVFQYHLDFYGNIEYCGNALHQTIFGKYLKECISSIPYDDRVSKIVKILLINGCEINSLNQEQGSTPMHFLLKHVQQLHAQIETAKYFVKIKEHQRANIFLNNVNKYILNFHVYEKIVKNLIKYGCDLRTLSWDSTIALDEIKDEEYKLFFQKLFERYQPGFLDGIEEVKRKDKQQKKLYKAVCDNKSEEVKKLLDQKVDPNFICLGNPLIFYAVSLNNLKCVKLLVEAGANINIKGKLQGHEYSLLAIATIISNPKMVSYLIDKGCDPNETIANKDPTIISDVLWHLPAILGMTETLKVFLNKGVNINAKSDNQYSIHDILSSEKNSTIKEMLRKGVNRMESFSKTEIYQQIKLEESIQLCSYAKTDQEATDIFNEKLSEMSLDSKILRKLIKHMNHNEKFVFGINTFMRALQKYPILLDGIGRDHEKCLDLIQQKITDPNRVFTQEKMKKNPNFYGKWKNYLAKLFEVVEKGTLEEFKTLTLRNPHFQYYLHAQGNYDLVKTAIDHRNLELVKYLIKEPDYQKYLDSKTLNKVLSLGNEEIFYLLMEQGIEKKSKYASRFLANSATSGNLKLLKEVLSWFDYEAILTDQRRIPTAFYAAESGNLDCLNYVLEEVKNSHPPLEYKDQVKGSILHCAVKGKNLEMIKELVEKGIQYDVEDNTYQTPLHLACTLDCPEIVEYLLPKYLALGKEIDFLPKNGTLLYRAVRDGTSLELVKLLVEKGASLTQKGHFSKQSVLDLVNKEDYTKDEIKNYLLLLK